MLAFFVHHFINLLLSNDFSPFLSLLLVLMVKVTPFGAESCAGHPAMCRLLALILLSQGHVYRLVLRMVPQA